MKRLAWLALLLVGCQPMLGDEYLCADRRECPPTHECWADGVCRRGTPVATGAICASDEVCSTRICAEEVDPMADDTGRYCTTACEDDDDCAGFPGAEPPLTTPRCISGMCRAGCTNPGDCPRNDMGTMVNECWVGIAMGATMPPLGGYCFHLSRNDLNGSRSCNGNAMTSNPCQLPGWCVQLGDRSETDVGLCSMICETRPMTRQCPMGSECAPLVMGFGQCMIPCPGGDGDCADAGLSCVEHSNGTSYCMPPTWAGMTLPTNGVLPDIVQLGGGMMMMPPTP